MAGLAHVLVSAEMELVADTDRPGSWILMVDGVAQSYVDLEDPTYLAFDYVRRIGDVLDGLGEPGAPLRFVHVGGAGMTLPRYVVATRPRSRQLVVEPDEAIVATVRKRLPWPRRAGIRVRTAEGRAALTTMTDGCADVVVTDAFTGGTAPEHLTTTEAFADVARVLGDAGTYLLNVADGPPLSYGRRVVAAALATWPHVLLLADASVIRGRRFGNLVLAASAAPLPEADVTRQAAGSAFPARVLGREGLVRLAAGAAPSTDADPAFSPQVPRDLWP